MSLVTFRRVAARATAPALVALLALFAGTAAAGSYTVRVCDTAGVNRAFAPIGDGSAVALDGRCDADRFLGMRVANSAAGGPVAGYTYGALEARAPGGALITAVHADATAFDEMGSSGVPGWRAGLADANGHIWCGVLRGCAWGGPPALRIDEPLASPVLRMLVICGASTCLRDRARAATTLKNVVIDVRDTVDPALSVLTGDLWASGWTSGSRSLRFAASDGPGIRRTTVTAGDLTVAAEDHPCDPFAMAPCPASLWRDAGLDTRRLPDGAHPLVVRAVDAGGNVTELRRTLYVDNTAPTVATPVVRGGSGWRAANTFEVEVDAKDGPGGSGVQGVSADVCRVDGTECFTTPLTGLAATATLAVPGPGQWKVRTWARDALRAGDKSAWSEPLRFDPTVPGRARVVGAGRWIANPAEQRLTVTLPQEERRGPSGIQGFAVTRDGSEPGTTATHAGETAGIEVADLPEGLHPIRARAISGAGVPSDATHDTFLGIDRTAPTVDLIADSTLPQGAAWISREVRIVAQGTDQPGLSGVDHIEYHVNDGPARRLEGPSGILPLDEDGVQAVSVRAVDGAGNVGPTRTATYRVDRTAPEGTMEYSWDPQHPSRLRATVAEECLREALFRLRPTTRAGEWKVFEARVETNGARASAVFDVPDGELPDGEYEARFELVDCAGNRGTIDRLGRGPARLQLPLRDQLDLHATLVTPKGRAVASARVRMGTSVSLRGVLQTRWGRPVEARRVRVEQRIGAGDWRTVTSDLTDHAGRVSFTLKPGPSRRLRLVTAPSSNTIGAVSPALSVAVPARATITVNRRTLRNGQTLRFSGRVLGGHLPRRGRELELQGFNPLRGRWQPVKTQGLRSNGAGRWRASYRFTATVGVTVRYRFRLRVPPHPGHPFADGHSRTVTVTVRG